VDVAERKGMMPGVVEPLIQVRCEWNGWRSAHVRISDIHGLHWFQPDHAPRRLIHGYISCTSIIDGAIPHGCDQTRGPHRLLVCILKKHTAPYLYADLARRADDRGAPIPIPAAVMLGRETW
jgi:hypothetical protein